MSIAHARYRGLPLAAAARSVRTRWPLPKGPQGWQLMLREPVTRSIEVAMLPQLACMSRLLGRNSHNKPLTEIHCRLKELLEAIEGLIVEGAIQPWRCVRLGAEDEEPASHERPIRLGVYPVSANPIHWGHILAGLAAIASARLDKVVYVVAGNDPRRNDLLAEEVRHSAARELLASFEPLLCYSPLARGTELDGETNLFRLLDLNPTQRIDAFYIAGTDHCRRGHPVTGEADTIRELESGLMRQIYGKDNPADGAHSLSILFLKREQDGGKPRTFIPLRFMPSPLPAVSSTVIRESLSAERKADVLAALPFTVFQCLQRVIERRNE